MDTQNVTTHVTDNTVAPATPSLILMDVRGKTVTLPEARGNAGLALTIKNTAAGGQTTLRAPGAATIDGKASYALVPPLAAVRVATDGANWWVVAAL